MAGPACVVPARPRVTRAAGPCARSRCSVGRRATALIVRRAPHDGTAASRVAGAEWDERAGCSRTSARGHRCRPPVHPPAPARAAPRRRGRLPVAKRICVVGRRRGRACEELQPALRPSGAEGGAAPGTKWRPTLSPPPAPACTAPPHRGSLSAAPRRPRGTGNTAGACKTTRPHRASLSAPHGAGRLGRPAALVVGNPPPLRRGMRRRVYRTGRGGARSPCHRQHLSLIHI